MGNGGGRKGREGICAIHHIAFACCTGNAFYIGRYLKLTFYGVKGCYGV